MDKKRNTKYVIYFLGAMILSYFFSGTFAEDYMRGIYWGLGGFIGFYFLYKLDPFKKWIK